ncbi:MAG: NAD(+) synthase [Candidatus Marinimicrobia bacterium]|nr:NAD(+) synthase [Candidatus Neomarinimicrobiota bacterium]|tara:strand:- start:1353 stop:2108 length:756 start_codon:yes stop_codon:yes gene_type:complete
MDLEEKISNWLSDYLINNNLHSFIIGISGGIDSAVTSTLCAMTGHKTYVIVMPIHQKEDETDRGLEHCKWLRKKYPNVEHIKIDLTSTFDHFKSIFPISFDNKLALANSRARIRMSALYLIAGNNNGIVVGTGNKIEDFGVGFFTKYGDGGVDISPIADLMKSEVYKLGQSLGVVDSIIQAKPTDGLWDDERTDEDQLGVSYDELEWAMNFKGDQSILTENQKNALLTYEKHRSKNLHKMKDIPIFKNDSE